MSENVAVTITVQVPRDALDAQVVTAEDIESAAQEYVSDKVIDFETMIRRVRLRRSIGVQAGDGNTQNSTFSL